MKKEHFLVFGVAFFMTLVIAAIAQAATVSEIWNLAFDSANNALRVIAQ